MTEPMYVPVSPQDTATPKRSRVAPVVVGFLVVALAAGAGGYALGERAERHRLAVAVTAAFGGLSTAFASPSASAPSSSSSVTFVPAVSDIGLDVKTLTKQCFGSAGCTLTVRVLFNAVDLEKLKGTSFEVTFSLSGGDSGPVVDSFPVVNGRYNAPEEVVSTSSKDVDPVATVTTITPR